jgi:hypothetical protein
MVAFSTTEIAAGEARARRPWAEMRNRPEKTPEALGGVTLTKLGIH